MVLNPVFLRSTNLEIHADRFFVENLQSFTVRKLGDFPSFLSALASNNAFIIELVKMWLGEARHVVVRTLKISLDQHFFYKGV